MRKATWLFSLAISVAGSAFAEDRHQSYIAYDDGGTMVRSGDGGREIEAHRNLPIYPGDEIVTARRGRTEVRLSDGNIIGIDRTSALRFRSILDSYEGDSSETVAELRHGKVAVHRTDLGREHVRLDTDNASYVAQHEAIYSVESDSQGRDRVTVFDGSVEVRTPTRSTRLRAGESADVDSSGVYDMVGDNRDSADDFERWFLARVDRYNGRSDRHLDRRLSYWADDLDDHGNWVFVTGIGWSWRPYVAVSWRPYYNGYWNRGRNGCLTWVSYDPWGWGTYHYGRWAHDTRHGWVWVPGYGYSPAWVYWMFGSGYVGWAPSGWWDCHRSYYNWAYAPYRNHDFGFGFNGRIRVGELDLRPWTFVDSTTLISNRIDRAALTTDAVKQRLGRSGGGFANVSGNPVRFTREELRDPAEAIRRRGLDGRSTGRETGAPPTDLTPFFRRDENVAGAVRDRIVRSRGGNDTASSTPSASPRTIGGLAPIGGGSVAPINRGSVAPITGGSSAPTSGSAAGSTSGSTGSSTGAIEGRRSGSGDRINRGTTPPAAPVDNDATRREEDRSGAWRGSAVDRESGRPRETTPPATTAPAERSNESWRSRVRSEAKSDPPSESTRSQPSSGSSSSSEVSRRVIDRIGGARIQPREPDSAPQPEKSRDSGRTRAPERSRDSGSTTRSRERSSSGESRVRPSEPKNDSGSRDSGSRDSSSARSNDASSSSKGTSGGRIKRDE